MRIESSEFHLKMKKYIQYLESFYNGQEEIYNFTENYIKPSLFEKLMTMSAEEIFHSFDASDTAILANTCRKFLYFKLNPTVDNKIQEQLVPLLMKGEKLDIAHWIPYLSSDTLEFLYHNASDIIKKSHKGWLTNHELLKFHEALASKCPKLFKEFIKKEKDVDKKIQMMLIVERKEQVYLRDIISLLGKSKDIKVLEQIMTYLEQQFLKVEHEDKIKILECLEKNKPVGYTESSNLLRMIRKREIDNLIFTKMDDSLKASIFDYLKISSEDICNILYKYIHDIKCHKKTGVFNISNECVILLNFIKEFHKETLISNKEIYLNAWCSEHEPSYRAVLYWMEYGELAKSSTHTDFFKSEMYKKFPYAPFSAKSKVVDSFKNLEIELTPNDLRKHLSNLLYNKPGLEEVNIVL